MPTSSMETVGIHQGYCKDMSFKQIKKKKKWSIGYDTPRYVACIEIYLYHSSWHPFYMLQVVTRI